VVDRATLGAWLRGKYTVVDSEPECDKHGLTPALLAAIRDEVLASFATIGQQYQLAPYEVPGGVVLEFDPWTVANWALVGVGKPCRPVLLQRYREAINSVYVELGH
jgi:hypothetical protein